MHEKIFLNTRTQIALLKSRGIIIKNRKWAKQIIRHTGYYNLINGYKDSFLLTSTPSEKYLPGTTLEEIYALYEFDRKLRILTIEYILGIEKHVKSLIANSFCEAYGHKNYLKLENFDIRGSSKYSQVCTLLSNLYKTISANIGKDLSISHYATDKNYIPLWVLVNTISLGETSKFFSNMKPKERNDVSRKLKWGLRENQLASCLFFLSSFRNRCAHDERLYSYLSYITLCPNHILRYFHISSHNANNYFSVIIALKLLLSPQCFDKYFSQLENLLEELSAQLHTIPVSKIKNIMGFPNNWQRIKTLK